MLRTLLVGILAVTAAAACSSKGDAPAAQPGVSAGRVVELTGKVTATRGAEVRTLAAGGEISADDVIDTAADGRVVILVAHNNARWDLGPNKHGKVGESLAWTAAKQDRPATVVIEESSTAGAHAEKSAATTSTTTAEGSKAAMVDRGTEQKPAAGAAAAPSATEMNSKGNEEAQGADPSALPPTGGSPPPSPPPPPRRMPASPPEPTRRAQGTEADTSTMTENNEDKKVSKPELSSHDPGPRVETGSKRDGGGGVSDAVRALQLEIRNQFAKERTRLRACFERTMPNVLIQIALTQGVYTITTVDRAATRKARACLATIAKSLGTTTKHDERAAVTLTLERL